MQETWNVVYITPSNLEIEDPDHWKKSKLKVWLVGRVAKLGEVEKNQWT